MKAEQNPKCFYHVDLTQAVSKVDINLENVDLASFSAHKFFGIKGIGGLIKKEKIVIEPLIHGGKSTTIFRSGTPATPLIVSLAKAMRLVYEDFDNRYKYVVELNKYLVDKLGNLKFVITQFDNSRLSKTNNIVLNTIILKTGVSTRRINE